MTTDSPKVELPCFPAFLPFPLLTFRPTSTAQLSHSSSGRDWSSPLLFPFPLFSFAMPSAFSPLLVLLHQQPVLLSSLVLSSLLLLPLTLYRLLHRPPSPTRKPRTRKFWFTIFVLVGPVWLLTPVSYLAFGWGCLASLGWGGYSWPEGRGAKIVAGVGVGWATLEVSSKSSPENLPSSRKEGHVSPEPTRVPRGGLT